MISEPETIVGPGSPGSPFSPFSPCSPLGPLGPTASSGKIPDSVPSGIVTATERSTLLT